MPVRYDIAAQVPQMQGGGFDPMNAFAQMQGLSYRQQQNALAEMQLAQAQRETQREQALAGLFSRQGFNPLTQQGLAEIARVDPSYFRQYITPYAGFQAEKARETAIYGSEERAKQMQPYAVGKAQLELAGEAAKYPGIQAESRKKAGEAVSESGRAIRELLRPVYMARTPEQAAERYADAYSQIKELDPKAARRLGYQYDPQAVEDYIIGPEEFKEARKPMIVEPGKLVTMPSGRPGETPRAVEPQFSPNAMATNQPAMNMLAQQGRMPPSADMSAPEVDPIVAKAIRKHAALAQLPPGPARETAGARMDLRDTLDQIDANFGALAEAGGIPRAGASSAENWKAAFKKSQTGQAIGGLSDSETNAQLASLRTAAAVLKAQLRKGLEMGITQMDAVKEMEKLDAAFLNPDKVKGLSEAYGSIQVLRRMIGAEGGTTAPKTRGKAGEAPKPMGEAIDFGGLKD
jgi:hypothetical protein